LELDESESLVVAATNHPQILDRALFRRFDAVIEYQLPSSAIAAKVMHTRLAFLDTSRVEWPKVQGAAEGLSHADIVRACEHVAKNALLSHRTNVDTPELVDALTDRHAARRK
jgi:SpoVK/Ycf46/Vps4 family AAA+-type ATPase